MSHKGMALMGVGEHEGENAAYEAIKAAIESPLLDNMSINGAMGILVHFYMHPDFPMMEITEAMDVIEESAHEDADVIWGTSTDASLAVDYIKITIVATGFERDFVSKNNEDFIKETSTLVDEPQMVTRPRKVVGGDINNFEFNFNNIDAPAIFRNRQD